MTTPTRRQARATRRKSPVQAQRRSRARLQKRLVRYAAVGAVGVIGALIIVALILPSIQRGTAQTVADRPTNGPGETFPDRGRNHIPQAVRASENAYSSTPPTSGDHWPVWTDCGIHDEPLANEMQIHNLEHGYVAIQYKTQDQTLINSLKEAAKKLPGWPDFYLLAPYPDMEQTIALTAWGVMQRLETVDEQAMRVFAEAYRRRGPEAVAQGCGTPAAG